MNWKGITLGLAALLATSCTNELDESSIDSSLREGIRDVVGEIFEVERER